jgi:hypothetical protein
MGRSYDEIFAMWETFKSFTSPDEFRQGLLNEDERRIFSDILSGRPKVSRANNVAKVVTDLKTLQTGFFAAAKKKNYVAGLSEADEQALYAHFNGSPHFSAKLRCHFTRAKGAAPLRALAPLRAPVPNAPPGYEWVSTTGDGDCLFYSIYYAVHPAEGIAKAQEDGSALSIRQIIANEANADDISVNNLKNDLTESIRLTQIYDPAQSAFLQSYLDRIQTIITTEPSIPRRQQLILPLYKEFVLLKGFWGSTRELDIFNRYGQRNGMPFVWIFNQRTQESLRLDPATRQFIPNAHPVHFNGINHYSILKEIDTPAAAQIRRNVNAVLEAQFAPSAEEIAREVQAGKRGELVTAIKQFLESRGVSEEIRVIIASDVPNQKYNSLQNANSAATYGKARAIELGVEASVAAELETLIRTKITALQGGKRKTRKQRKVAKRHTRKH